MGLKYLKNVANIKLDEDKCIGCSMCVNVCPHEVFEINNNKAFIENRDNCIECGACDKNCPANAIEVKPGVG